MFLVANERTKLTSNWLNSLATALVAAGVLAPAAAWLYGLSQPLMTTRYVSVLAVGCLVAGLLLHVVGRLALRRLRE